jgi:hypothetical protein
MTTAAAWAAGTDQPATPTATIKTASHTEFLTRPAESAGTRLGSH